MSTYSVSLNSMNDAISQAQQIASNISNELSELESNVQQRLSDWTGDAQQSYQARKAAWDAAAAAMPQSLNQASTTLNHISDLYSTSERTVAGTFGG